MGDYRVPTEQCVAMSKRTRKRCGQLVPGGGVCTWHGGAASQVLKRREARVAVAEAGVIFGDYGERDPSEVLLAAVADADAVLQRLKDRAALSEHLTGTDVEALGDWLDRAHRMAKVALDARVQERQVRIAEATNRQMASEFRERLEAILVALGHDPDDRQVMQVVVSVLRRPLPTVIDVPALEQ